MKTALRAVLAACALSVVPVGAACTADVHDNTVNINAQLSVNAQGDVEHVNPGSSVALALNVQNATLVDPSATPPPEHVADAVYIQIYLDDLSSTPILITAQVNVSVTIPAGTSAGSHKLRCRVHKHDGTPTTVVTDVSITVVAGTMPGDAGSQGDGSPS
jgi:hypothetical protein